MDQQRSTSVYWFGAGTPYERFVGERRTPADREVYKADGKWIIEGLDDSTTQSLIAAWRRPDGLIWPGPEEPAALEADKPPAA